MKKEPKSTTTNLLPKIIAIFMLIAAAILVHLEYFTQSVPEANIMQVFIASGDGAEEEKVLESKVDESSGDNNAVAIISKDSKDSKEDSSAQNKLAHYRIYLFNVISLSTKFLQHEDYDKEITFLLKNTDNFSHDIIKLLEELKDYRDKNLTSQNIEYNKVALDNSFTKKMISKIIDIERKNPQYEINKAVYNKLKGRLNDLALYFYSKEFLKKYLDND